MRKKKKGIEGAKKKKKEKNKRGYQPLLERSKADRRVFFFFNVQARELEDFWKRMRAEHPLVTFTSNVRLGDPRIELCEVLFASRHALLGLNPHFFLFSWL